MSIATDTICQQEGCERVGLACYLPAFDGGSTDAAPDGYYCADHCRVQGYCYGCGSFWGGVESFEFDPRGLCDNCREEWDDDDDNECRDYADE